MTVDLLPADVEVHTYLGAHDERALADDVLDGLTRPFKELPPKHFYDARGAELFDRICELPEYYPTRTERAILEARAAQIVERTGAAEIVELGSGTAAKTRILLDAMQDAGTLRRYVPLDVTEHMILATASSLVEEYPGLLVHGIVGDFERHLHHLPPALGPRLVAFLGGTIGNFTPGSRRRFLRGLAKAMGPDDHLLLGTDLVKDPAVIEAAYDDSEGVTAEFNRNVLHVVNRELGADFDVDAFTYVPFWDPHMHRMDLRLRAEMPQHVTIPGAGVELDLASGEEIRMEISTKFSREMVRDELGAVGLDVVETWTDARDDFAVTLARKRPDA
jgi:L-histidine Nalpha-methyltransferase